MPTTQQLIRKGRHRKKRKASTKLDRCPQRKGVVTKVSIKKPKKPNSAERKVARVRLSNGAEVTAMIPGEGHNAQEHSQLLIRGGRTADLPGVKHKAVRGAADLQPPMSITGTRGESIGARKQARSKFGQKRS